MDRYLRLIVVALALGVLVPRLAEAAAGTITGLTVSPSTVTAGAAVTIQIQGSGTCDGGTFDFGDGTPARRFINFPLPYTMTHPYSTTGILTVTVKGVTNCKGTKSAQLTVNPVTGAPAPLRRVVPPGVVPLQSGLSSFSRPRIASVLPFSQPWQGGAVIVGGENFGDTPGKFLLVSNELPGGALQLTLAPGAEGWGDTHAAGTIPQGCLWGDKQAWLQIENGRGFKSQGWPVTFKGRPRVETTLQADDPLNIDCSQNGGSNGCSAGSRHDTLYGNHSGFRADHGPQNLGQDIYTMRLKNCWRPMQPFIISKEGDIRVSIGARDNLGGWYINVEWSYVNTPAVSRAAYSLIFRLEGPEGLMYR
jgi:hypothetical protein